MKNLALYPYAVMVAGIITFISCDSFNYCLQGNGNYERESRNISDFYGIVNNTGFKVRVSADSIYSVFVSTDDNLLSYIKTSVIEGNLVIDTKSERCLNSDRNILVDIQMPLLDLVELHGSGDIEAFTMDCANLQVKNTGSGDINLLNFSANKTELTINGSGDISVSGEANRGEYHSTGSGDLFADDFVVNSGFVYSSGSGDVYCNVKSDLEIIISGSGDVFYEGLVSDSVVIDDSGSGSAINRY